MTKSKNILTLDLFKKEQINKNDIVFAVIFILHKYSITAIQNDFLTYLEKNYNEYLLDILLKIPDSKNQLKEQLFLKISSPKPREILKILEIFRNDEKFCNFVVDHQEKNK